MSSKIPARSLVVVRRRLAEKKEKSDVMFFSSKCLFD
jgi:hypothetical protein